MSVIAVSWSSSGSSGSGSIGSSGDSNGIIVARILVVVVVRTW